MSLEELLNEFNDMIAPAQPSRFRLAELQRCGLAHNVLSALTNVRKYLTLTLTPHPNPNPHPHPNPNPNP